MSQRRVVVIGGGAVGLATAVHLTKMDQSLDVLVLEADYVGSGSFSRSLVLSKRNTLVNSTSQFALMGESFATSLPKMKDCGLFAPAMFALLPKNLILRITN